MAGSTQRKRERISVLQELDTQIGNSGSDEHSHITQVDQSLTPGGADPLLHLLGTTNIPAEVQTDITYAIANAFADRAIDGGALPVEDMDFSGQLAVAFALVQNSVNGKGLDRKTNVFTASGIGSVKQKIGGWFGKGKGYESGGFNEQ